MLYSAKFKIVYIKSRITASTSVEAVLDFLITGKIGAHVTPSLFLNDGSRVGLRQMKITDDPNYGSYKFIQNHASASEIKNSIGNVIWQKCIKVSSIRNPYSQMVSRFLYSSGETIEKCVSMIESGSRDHLNKNFLNFFVTKKNNSHYNGKEHFFLNNKSCIDLFIRQEFMSADLNKLFNRLHLNDIQKQKMLNLVPNYKKSSFKSSNILVKDFFNEDALKLANIRFADWFSLGGYKMINKLKDLNF